MTSRTVTKSVDLGECGEKDIEFTVDYTPAEPASGMFGPWEHSTPGSSSEIDITGATIDGHDVLWLFDVEGLRLIEADLLESLDDEEPDFDEPECGGMSRRINGEQADRLAFEKADRTDWALVTAGVLLLCAALCLAQFIDLSF